MSLPRSSRCLLALCAGLQAAALAPCPRPARAEVRYEMEQADRRDEKRKFLERLLKDRAKVDQAVANTKTLINRSRQRPYLPDLYLRLAELFVEKSRLVYFIRVEETPAGAKTLDHLESDALKRDAIEVYQRILSEFPEYAQRDKVLFFLAHEYRELGQIEEMLARYGEILRKFKDGPYAAEAHLLLGDHFFNAKDLESARRHYEAVFQYPGSPALVAARYKLGWCYINEGDWKSAIGLFEQAVATGDGGKEIEIDTYRKVDVRLESLVDMAYCYCEQYKDASPEEAVRYFERYAWSLPSLTVGLEKLGQRYYLKKKWQHAAHVYRKLSALRNDPEKLLEYAGRVFECVRATGTFEQADEDMALIVKALKAQRYSAHIPEDVKARNLGEFELYARDIATHLHQRARELDSAESFGLAAAAYRAYLEFFDKNPVRAEMRRNFAEALFAGKQFLEAGKEYERISKGRGLKEAENEEALYGAVLSYYQALKARDRLSAYGRVFARAGLRATGQQYAAAFPKSERVPNVLFNVAWVAYDEGKYETAIEEFSRFVDANSGRPEAAAAVHLTLDAYNLREDFQGLTRYGEKIVGNPSLDEGLRREVGQILHAAEAKIITPMAVAAARDWEAGKRTLLDFAAEHRSSSLGDQALQTVVASSAKKGDLKTLFSAGADLLERAAAPERVEEVLNLFIDTCVQASHFRELARFLEDFGRRLPSHRTAPEFLLKSAQIRESLGQDDLAAADYELLRREGGKPAEQRDLALRVAENAVRRSQPQEALAALLAGEKEFEGASRLRADAMIASLYLAQGKTDAAAAFLARAREAWEALTPSAQPAAADAFAQMEFASLSPARERFLKLRLGPAAIDDVVVREKGDLLAALLEGYHHVIGLGSAPWALRAFHAASDASEEFARFLQEAPLPADLSEEERQDYVGMVNGNVERYRAEARQYAAKGAELARKWEICDPELAGYFLARAEKRSPGGFSGALTYRDAAGEWLGDPTLLEAHTEALGAPQDPKGMARLARLYVNAGDPRQAVLIAQKALEALGEKEPTAKASLLNTVGVAYLYANQDPLARDALRQAADADPGNAAVRLNLAALLRYYGHEEKAQELYAGLVPRPPAPEDGDLVHPRSLELYDAFVQHAQR